MSLYRSMEKLLYGQRPGQNETPSEETLPRAERIARFNNEVDQCERLHMYQNIATTSDYVKKARSGAKPHLETLSPISLSELEVGVTHRGRALYCRIVSKVMVMKSAMVLVEDDEKSGISNLAVYGLADPTVLKEGRLVVVLEPFFKLRYDNTKGIRVDDPTDLIFDVALANMPSKAEASSAKSSPIVNHPPTVEARLQELVLSDPSIVVSRLQRVLVQEGYDINKQRVRALKASLSESEKEAPRPLAPILSERRPEKDRVFRSPEILVRRGAGNEAFKAKRYSEAEQCYTDALDLTKARDLAQHTGAGEHGADESEGVHLWQLYANRCAARMHQGKLVEAMQDGLASNMCAPGDEVKPVLRCAEALAALGMQKEMVALLDSASNQFQDASDAIGQKKSALSPSNAIWVGKDREIRSISRAIAMAPAGAEILVEPGMYDEDEPLLLTKSVTLRCSAINNDFEAIDSLDGGSSNASWAVIRVDGYHAVICHAPRLSRVHLIGFRIICSGSPQLSLHSVFVARGVVVLRNCFITGSSGPVLAAQFKDSRVIAQTCAICDGAQGGILVVDNAVLHLQQTHSCGHAANGLEVRTGGFATVERSFFYGNGRQGILVWKSAGGLSAKDCDIHSNTNESGVLVSEADVSIDSCRIYGNGAAGIVAQQKGRMNLYKCSVHDNLEGVLIQDTGSADVEKCVVFSNRANGIFVGYDHRGKASIVENEVFDNVCRGVYVANSGKVVVRGNKEHGNRGLPPVMLGNLAKAPYAKSALASRKHWERVKKNSATITKAHDHGNTSSLLDSLFQQKSSEFVSKLLKEGEERFEACAFCKAAPPNGKRFSRCSRCKAMSYCSPKCQKMHWPEHKLLCVAKLAEYPAFLDPKMSV